VAILLKYGVPEEDASIIADSIVYAHTRGKHTHGIGRMPIYIRKIREKLINPETPILFLKDSPVISVIDAQNGFGQVAAIRAMELCINKAKQFGVGIVGVKDSNNFGTAGFIGEYAANNKMIGIIMSNSGPAIAPTGGGKAIFGTNPICVSFPSDGTCPPIIFDMACSSAARGKIRMAAKNGEKIPFGWAVDTEGNNTDDPNEALKGTMIPIGGYKGYGISMCIDILAGMLTGSAFGGEVKNLNHPTEISRYGHMIMAINPEFFITKEEYFKELNTLINNVKKCGKESAIFLPGEKSYYIAASNKEYVDIEQNLIDDMNNLANSVGTAEQLKIIKNIESERETKYETPSV